MHIYIYIYIYITKEACTEEAAEMAAIYMQNKKNVFLIILENNCTLLQ